MASLSLNLAVPGARLLKADDDRGLSFVAGSWVHLNTFIDKVESLPADFKGGSEAAGKAFDKLRQAVQSFGSPMALRQLLTGQPDALAKTDGAPSPLPYIQIVWVIQSLHATAGIITSHLRSLAQLAGSSNKLSEDVKPVLRELGSATEKGRAPIGPLIDSLRPFKAEVLSAYNQLSAAYQADADALQKMQESVGGLQVTVVRVQKEIGELGIFSSKAHRVALEQQLHSAKQQLQDTSARADQLRAALGQLEPILNEGRWLESGVDDLVEFLGNLRKVLTTFGSALTQLAVDAAAAEIGDAAALGRTLGLDEAIQQWTAIDAAAKQFTVQSLADRSVQ
jgi:hypothetical protein